MTAINYEFFERNIPLLTTQWNDNDKPFKYIIFDDFLQVPAAEEILQEYPDVESGNWDGATYIHQKNKFSLKHFGPQYPALDSLFKELNGEKFISFLSHVTGINDLLGDEELFGGGLHQSVKGAFLDVHVDFNHHDTTRHHRRMNAIIYMNKNWRQEYNGYLELWDMKEKRQIEMIAPVFNRLVIFETNEHSYHGHPKPLNTPKGITRKSVAVYYYTKERPAAEIAQEHNTIYVNTEGSAGKIKTISSALKALKERLWKRS
jgi:Rps23 Pro-64 3,4-dihydroxylase Tpa1-like proline 4-hydroxylase